MIPLEEIRLRLAEPPEADNELLEDLEARAVKHIEQRTGQTFGAVGEVTERVRSGYLSAVPVGAVTLEYRSHVGGEWTAFAASDFEIDGREVRLLGYWWPLEIRATYSHGYTAGLEPADIRGAVLDLVALWYDPEAESAPILRANVDAVINSRRRMPA